MKKFLFLVLTAITLFACTDETDFSVDETEIGGVEIRGNNHSVNLLRDTSWYIADNEGRRINSCDEYKISAFFNVLRDVQVMGLSNYPQNGDFDSEVVLKKNSGKILKTIRLKSVAGSSQMIGSVDGGKCYFVGVPGLNVSPISNFASTADYWKDLSLLELTPDNISKISVENFLEPEQSFFISTVADGFEIRGIDGNFIAGISEQNIRRYLGGIAGTYRAAQYVDVQHFTPADTICRLSVRTRLGDDESIIFFKKMNGSQPDFNLMFFRKNGEHGLAKYYDFDKVLVEAEGLK